MDSISKEARSANMARIRSKSNRSTEWRLRAMLMRRGIQGWKLHAKNLPGSPDFVFDRARVALFVDGCFWHCCPKCGHTPKSNRGYWSRKLDRNRKRDAQVSSRLRRGGWRVIRIWECELASANSGLARKLARLDGLLRQAG